MENVNENAATKAIRSELVNTNARIDSVKASIKDYHKTIEQYNDELSVLFLKKAELQLALNEGNPK